VDQIFFKWYQSGILFVYCRQRRQKEDRVVGGLCKDLFAGRQQSIDSQQDCKMKLETLKMQSDSSRSAREADKHSKMATEGHKHAERKSPELMSAAEMDKELADIKREMEELEMKMRQGKKLRWVYEWPMKTPKVKWPVRELMVKGQQRLLRRWLRYAENLRPIEEEEWFRYVNQRWGEILNDLE
jgi:hypothetical protein